MEFSEWEPIYRDILAEMGYDRSSDETSARLLRALMVNADLITDDDLAASIGDTVSVFGAADTLEVSISKKRPEGTLIAAGSATSKMMRSGFTPDIIVTDLDGEIEDQIKASENGAITLIHAHGDNNDAIMKYAKEFTGPVMLTTQSVPDNVLFNFGGFTDGDRAVCLADHFRVGHICLYGFDFEHPSDKVGSDPAVKLKKLAWAKRIIAMASAEIISL